MTTSMVEQEKAEILRLIEELESKNIDVTSLRESLTELEDGYTSLGSNINKTDVDAEKVSNFSLKKDITSFLEDKGSISLPYLISTVSLMAFKVKGAKKKTWGSGYFLAIAVVDTMGIIHLYDDKGFELCNFDLGHGSTVGLTTIKYYGQEHNRPMIVSGAADGSVHFHQVSIFKHNKQVAGSFLHSIPQPSLNSANNDFTINMYTKSKIFLQDVYPRCSLSKGICRPSYLDEEKGGEEASMNKEQIVDQNQSKDKDGIGSGNISENGDEGTAATEGVDVNMDGTIKNKSNKSKEVSVTSKTSGSISSSTFYSGIYATSVLMYQKSDVINKNVAIIGDNQGHLIALLDDGEPLPKQYNFFKRTDGANKRNKESKDSKAITDIMKVGQILMISDKNRIQILHLRRFRSYGYDCDCKFGNIVSLMPDPNNKLIVYALTDSGMISVFQTKVKEKEGDVETNTCKNTFNIYPDKTVVKGASAIPHNNNYQKYITDMTTKGLQVSSFAGIKGIVASGGRCGFSIYAATGSRGMSSTNFIWASADKFLDDFNDKEQVLGCPVTNLGAVRGVARSIKKVIWDLPVASFNTIKKHTWNKNVVVDKNNLVLNHVYVDAIKSQKRAGSKKDELPNYILTAYNRKSAQGIGSTIRLYEGKSTLQFHDDLKMEDVFGPIASHVSWLRPIILLVVVFLMTMKARGNIKKSKKKSKDSDDDDDDESSSKGIMDFLMPWRTAWKKKKKSKLKRAQQDQIDELLAQKYFDQIQNMPDNFK